ncbi:hypothetical protein Tco_0608957 [Tanacetum coccineum]
MDVLRRCPRSEPWTSFTFVHSCGRLAAGFVYRSIGIHAHFGAFCGSFDFLLLKKERSFAGALVEKVRICLSNCFCHITLCQAVLEDQMKPRHVNRKVLEARPMFQLAYSDREAIEAIREYTSVIGFMVGRMPEGVELVCITEKKKRVSEKWGRRKPFDLTESTFWPVGLVTSSTILNCLCMHWLR